MPRSGRALRRCISHSAHARTSVEARTHAHRADRTQKPDTSKVFKHKKYGKHAQTEILRRHGQGLGHAVTKLGQEAPDVTFRSRATNNFAQNCVTVHTCRDDPPRLTRNFTRAHATRCASSLVRALRSWEDRSVIACARAHIGPVGNAPFEPRPGDV